MHTSIEFAIVGTSPLLLHNCQLADPANRYAMAIKKLGKCDTPEKAQKSYDLSWEGSLYVDDEGRVIMPGENLESALVEAAGAFKLKKSFKAAVYSVGSFPILYDGPSEIERLKADPRFRDLRSVKTKRGDRVMFCRPKFVEWSLRFAVLVDTDVVGSAKVIDILKHAGTYCGIGSYRPKYGRFIVTSAKVIDNKVKKSA